MLRQLKEAANEINQSKPMLNGLARKLIDKDVRTLIKGGLMTEDLELTSEGKQEVWALLYEQFKKDLVKVAEDRIEEAKK